MSNKKFFDKIILNKKVSQKRFKIQNSPKNKFDKKLYLKKVQQKHFR